MYTDDIKLLEKDGKEFKALIQTINQKIGMEFVKGKCSMLIMRSGKDNKRKELNYRIRKKSEHSEKWENYKYL